MRLVGRRTACVILAAAGLGAFAAVGSGRDISIANAVDLRFYFAYHGEVVRVDPASGLVDGRTPIPGATPGTKTEVVGPADGENVYTRTQDGALSGVDPMTLEATGTTSFSSGVEPVEGEHHSYVLEPATGRVSVYPPGKLGLGSTAAPGQAVTLKAGWRETVVDAASVLWVLGHDGRTLHRLDGSAHTEIRIDGDPATDLTLVEGRVTLYRPGEVLLLGDDGQFSSVGVDLAGYDRVELGTATSIGPNLWLVASGDKAEAVLVEVDLGAEAGAEPGERRRHRLPGAGIDLDAPVFDGTTVFVADQDKRAVHTLEVGSADPQPQRLEFDPDDDATDVTVTRRGDWTSVHDGAGNIYNVRPGEALVRERGIPLGPPTADPEAGTPPNAAGPTPTASTPAPSTPPTEPPADQALPAETLQAPPRLDQVAAPGATPTPAPAGQEDQLPGDRVPDVVGQDKDAGCEALRAAGFNCQQRAAGQIVADPFTRDGTILATTPGANSTFELGATVVVDYASAGAPVLVGRSAADVCAQVVTPAGLTCDPAPGTGVAPAVGWLGLVSSQSPAAGEAVEPGDTITYSYYDRIAAPNLVGMPQADACAAIQLSALLTCQVGATVPGTAGTTAGTVAAQNPPAGAEMPAVPTTVTIDVYAAPAPVVPAVVGAGITVDAACAQVAAAGLTCQQVVSPYPVPGEVFAQNPAAGTVTTPGTVVQVSVWTLPRREILRYRQKDMDRVWLLRMDPSGVPTDRYELRDGAGFAAAPAGTPETDQFLVPITDFMCPTCAYDINHYHTADGQPPSGSGWQSNGVQAYVFRDQVPGSEPLYRLFRDAPEGRSWAYASPSEGAYSDYVGRGYGNPVPLGYVWPN